MVLGESPRGDPQAYGSDVGLLSCDDVAVASDYRNEELAGAFRGLYPPPCSHDVDLQDSLALLLDGELLDRQEPSEVLLDRREIGQLWGEDLENAHESAADFTE